MLRQLEYQDRVLSTLEVYLNHLKDKKAQADKAAEVAAQNPDVDIRFPDFTEETWKAMRDEGKLPRSRAHIPFEPHKDGCSRPVPNITLKVPTGGGKTWLAINAVYRVLGSYLRKNTGFVLWIVPNEAIYSQTLKHLKDRQHPYRLALDRAAAGKVLIMEKNSRLDARDVDANLAVMLLMLQSANRETKETLRMFRDRGDVHGFCPPEGEQQKHAELLEAIPNLDGYGGVFPLVKDSLGNALRIIRPLVVLDEGHRATSDSAYKTLYGFNPCFVLELTATPKDIQPKAGKNRKPGRNVNVLTEVTGKELDRENMIKMPVNLDARPGTDWRATLNAAVAKLRELEKTASRLHADKNRYIRPIMLIQVERTGADQRDSVAIHAEDAREWLQTQGFDEAEIAVKTAERNDLKQPENQDLLSPCNPVRAIITKQALQEGWDCPFAYILCSLAASSSRSAMTQLVGRILRQPYAQKNGISLLDECHIITHHAGTAAVVKAIKEGLERDGLGDLSVQISQDGPYEPGVARKIRRREQFKNKKIYLPKIMLAGELRELDYETDILSRIPWPEYDPHPVAQTIPETSRAAEHQMQRIWLGKEGEDAVRSQSVVAGNGQQAAARNEFSAFDPVHATFQIADLVSNPFIGREIVGKILAALQKRGFADAFIGQVSQLIVEELRKDMRRWCDERAETFFKQEVDAQRIQFRLRADGKNWRMPFDLDTTKPKDAPRLVDAEGEEVQNSLFHPVYRSEFGGDELNQAEEEVAVYLDKEETLKWWHRNVARAHYGLQGWKKGKIYPDFIFSLNKQSQIERLMVLETKGDHLDNPDTEYKREVLRSLSKAFRWDEQVPVGELELVQNNGETVHAKLILMDAWKTELPNWIRNSE